MRRKRGLPRPARQRSHELDHPASDAEAGREVAACPPRAVLAERNPDKES